MSDTLVEVTADTPLKRVSTLDMLGESYAAEAITFVYDITKELFDNRPHLPDVDWRDIAHETIVALSEQQLLRQTPTSPQEFQTFLNVRVVPHIRDIFNKLRNYVYKEAPFTIKRDDGTTTDREFPDTRPTPEQQVVANETPARRDPLEYDVAIEQLPVGARAIYRFALAGFEYKTITSLIGTPNIKGVVERSHQFLRSRGAPIPDFSLWETQQPDLETTVQSLTLPERTTLISFGMQDVYSAVTAIESTEFHERAQQRWEQYGLSLGAYGAKVDALERCVHAVKSANSRASFWLYFMGCELQDIARLTNLSETGVQKGIAQAEKKLARSHTFATAEMEGYNERETSAPSGNWLTPLERYFTSCGDNVRSEDLEIAVASMSEKQRSVFKLWLEKRSQLEIGEKLDISYSAVNFQVTQIRRKIQNCCGVVIPRNTQLPEQDPKSEPISLERVWLLPLQEYFAACGDNVRSEDLEIAVASITEKQQEALQIWLGNVRYEKIEQQYGITPGRFDSRFRGAKRRIEKLCGVKLPQRKNLPRKNVDTGTRWIPAVAAMYAERDAGINVRDLEVTIRSFTLKQLEVFRLICARLSFSEIYYTGRQGKNNYPGIRKKLRAYGIGTPTHTSQQKLDYATISETVEHIPTRQKEVVRLWATGLSYEEIGRKMEINKRTVSAHFFKAKRALRKYGIILPNKRTTNSFSPLPADGTFDAAVGTLPIEQRIVAKLVAAEYTPSEIQGLMRRSEHEVATLRRDTTQALAQQGVTLDDYVGNRPQPKQQRANPTKEYVHKII